MSETIVQIAAPLRSPAIEKMTVVFEQPPAT
jgi:hypothetical protein